MKKKFLAASIIIMVLGLTACGNKEQKGTDSGVTVVDSYVNKITNEVQPTEEGAKVDLSEKLTFSAFQQADDNPEFSYDENAVIQYWKDMFNIDFDWQFPPQGSEAEQLTLMLGTGDYTELIDLSFCTENLGTLHDDGVLYDLAPYIEEYMPNYSAFLNNPNNADVRSALFDDKGRLFTLAIVSENPKQWGGLLYRRDILETMTGNNVVFPSGNDNPTTIEDWDYMLPLMKQYYEASGMEDYACLIIPADGYFANGILLEGFGIGGTDYVDKDGKVQYGISQDNFYNYLVKIKEWYDAGYIYGDFASRTQDLFYLPNTALTYGGAAGIWYGFAAQLGGAMSIPDYNLIMNVHPAPSPVMEGTEPVGTTYTSRAMATTGWGVTKVCSEEKLLRIMTAVDYLYSKDGGATRTMGLSAEQGAGDYEAYVNHGMVNGTRKDGSTDWTDEMMKDTREVTDYAANRLPGLVVDYPARESDYEDGIYLEEYGDEAWMVLGGENAFPYTVSFTSEESAEISSITTNMQDYASATIAKFIMGRDELSPESFKAYQDKLDSLGLATYLSVKQTAYDRYISR